MQKILDALCALPTLWLTAFALILSACGPLPPYSTDPAKSPSANDYAQTLRVIYTALDQQHVTELDLSDFTQAGFRELELPLPNLDQPHRGNEVGRALYAALSQTKALENQNPQDVLERFVEAGLSQTLGSVRFTRYLNPTELSDFLALIDGGAGIGIQVIEDERGLRITDVTPASPAEKANLQAGDLILSVNGASLADIPEHKARIETLRGPEGAGVRLTLSTDDGFREVRLVRTHQSINQLAQEQRLGSLGYIPLLIFDRNAANHVRQAYRRLTHQGELSGLILDLRDNGGGSVIEARRIIDQFVPAQTPLYRIGTLSSSTLTRARSNPSVPLDMPLIVLINARSASASELVAGVLQDTGRAVVIGSQSLGKGSQQTITILPNGGALAITNAFIFRADGRPLSHLGVVPQICVQDVSSTSSLIDRLLSNNQPSLRLYAQTSQSADRVNAICPRNNQNKAQALEIAQALLRNKTAYTAALRL